MADDDKRQKQMEIAARAGEAIRLIPTAAETAQRLYMVRGQMAEVVQAALSDHPPKTFTDGQSKALVDCLALMTLTLHPSRKPRGVARAISEFREAPIWQKIATVTGSLALLGILAAGVGYGAANLDEIRGFVVQLLGGEMPKPKEPEVPDLLGNGQSGGEVGM